jgi:CRISPR-associated protein Csm3
MLDEESKKKFISGEIVAEFKTEIKMNRKTGTAEQDGPRTIERVPPSVKFKGEILIRYFDGELDNIKSVLKKGIELLNQDYLGGSGSRGYGAVKVTFV